MRTVLIISRYFPPRYDVGGKRAYRFARHLPEHGWRPIVLTGVVPAGYPADPTPLRLPPAVEVVDNYAPSWWRYRRQGLADGTRSEPIPVTTTSAARRWFDALTTLPLRQEVLLAPRTALWARRLARSTPIDLVFATAPPWAALAHGYAVSRAVGAPLCLDLRDPWALGFLHHKLLPWVRWAEGRAEASLMARADRVILTCDGIARAYRDRFPHLPPEHFTVISNSFEPSLRPPEQPRAARPTLVHFGNCYGPRTLEPVLRALAALRRRGLAGDLRLLNLGRVKEADLRLAEQLGVRDCIEYRAMLPYGEAMRVLAGADLQLLLAYGDETGYVPAKFFDYLLSGAPILCVARPSSLTELVAETGAGRWAEPDRIEEIADVIATATRRSGETKIARPNATAIDRFSAPRTTAELARVFDDILAERRSGIHSFSRDPCPGSPDDRH